MVSIEDRNSYMGLSKNPLLDPQKFKIATAAIFWSADCPISVKVLDREAE